MSFDIPTDLINKSQIVFREAAGLSSFDRNNTSPPSISTVESSISSLDPSPSYLRCKFCQGKLLRGLQSLICIYCGEYQKKDLDPEPISFNSTHGYSWLLQSLNFNGSERVGSLADGSGVDGGQRPAEDELTLSELLDLKITWREPEKPENNNNIKFSDHNSSSNFGTADFDNFFTKSVSNSANVSDVLEEQPVASKSDENKIVEGQENVTSDWNAEFQFADTKVESEKPESVDLFAGAEATKVESEKPKSVDLFSGARADLSAHMDLAFGQTESFDFKKRSNVSDLFQDDIFANMSSSTFQQNDQLDSDLQAKDILSTDLNESNLKDADGDWFSDGNWQENSVKNIVNDVSLQDDLNAKIQFADTKVESEKPESVDLFAGAEADPSAHMDVAFGQTESFDFRKRDNVSDPFQDDLFANMSSTFQQNDQLDSDLQAKDILSTDLNESNLKDADGDWFSDGNWQKSSVKNTLNDVSVQDNLNGSSTDWFENTNWQNVSTNNTATVKDDNLFDIKPHANDTILSGKSDLENSDKQNSDVTDWFQNSQWAIGGSTSATNIEVSKVNDDDDGFGEWNAFTSATGNQGSVQGSWKESGSEKVDYGTSEKMSELNLFEPTIDTQDVDFGNFFQSDKNPTDTRTVHDIFSEVPTGNRNGNTEAGTNVEGSKNDDFFSNATTNPKDDVQKLMSQMHDLSFMLKNELSVPSKPDDIGTSRS